MLDAAAMSQSIALSLLSTVAEYAEPVVRFARKAWGALRAAVAGGWDSLRSLLRRGIAYAGEKLGVWSSKVRRVGAKVRDGARTQFTNLQRMIDEAMHGGAATPSENDLEPREEAAPEREMDLDNASETVEASRDTHRAIETNAAMTIDTAIAAKSDETAVQRVALALAAASTPRTSRPPSAGAGRQGATAALVRTLVPRFGRALRAMARTNVTAAGSGAFGLAAATGDEDG